MRRRRSGAASAARSSTWSGLCLVGDPKLRSHNEYFARAKKMAEPEDAATPSWECPLCFLYQRRRTLARAPLSPHPPALPLRLNHRTGTYFCVDLSVTAVVIKGLAEHKDELGAPLCPCRHYDDKAAEAEQGYWNCPCVPMRERKVRAGQCVGREGRGLRVRADAWVRGGLVG